MNDSTQLLIQYYDEFQAKLFDYAKEAEIINSVLGANLVGSVVDVGCGTGTHLVHLAKMGYECMGIDSNREMLRRAKNKAEEARVDVEFVEADITDLAMIEHLRGKFDASIWIRNTLSTIDEVRIALKAQHSLLKDNGIMIFDILQADDSLEDEILNMDVVVKEDTTVIRLNDFSIRDARVYYQSVYFLQSKGPLEMVTDHLVLPLVRTDDLERILWGLDFQYKGTIYEYIGIPRTRSHMILAAKRGGIGAKQ